MLEALTVMLACQLLGQLIVVGMAILFLSLLRQGRIPEELCMTAGR